MLLSARVYFRFIFISKPVLIVFPDMLLHSNALEYEKPILYPVAFPLPIAWKKLQRNNKEAYLKNQTPRYISPYIYKTRPRLQGERRLSPHKRRNYKSVRRL